MSCLFESFLSTPEVTELLSDRAVVGAMLRFEAALVRAQAIAGLIPQAAAQSIMGTCKVELFDVPKLVRESAQSRSLAKPLVSSLRETVSLFNPQAASFVHVGCSDQDLVDTALSLVVRDVLKLIETDLGQTIQTLLKMAVQHAADAMLARSQPPWSALTSFGLMCSQWAAPLVRSQRRLQSACSCALSLSLSLRQVSEPQALAALQDKGPQLITLMAADLQLNAPDFVGDSAQDESVALACELGVLVGSLGKIAADIAHLAAFDIGELMQATAPLASAPGARPAPPLDIANLCMVAQAAAQRVPQQVAVLLAMLSQAHGSAVDHSQAQLAPWPALLTASQGICHVVTQLVTGLQPDTQRMRSNLEAVRAGLPGKSAKARFSGEMATQAVALAHTQVAALRAL
ncbi:MAG: lyase family protein [Rhodoferax sp.]|uniref:lyase family protein n=1 Tax=Rhodoferax sp. TaxID=50421 RepID=UPI0026139E45|nr:lyase family protein [Rhodoferax sp.]MDD2882440.1 lyase family protein [Rhodoferax sp.]